MSKVSSIEQKRKHVIEFKIELRVLIKPEVFNSIEFGMRMRGEPTELSNGKRFKDPFFEPGKFFIFFIN